MWQAVAVIVPFLSAVTVAVIAKLQFSKDPRVGPIAPNTTVYSLLAQQDAEINALKERMVTAEQAFKLCEQREKDLLARLGLDRP